MDNMKSFKSIAGIKINYNRVNYEMYRSKGIETTFRSNEKFYSTLEKCFKELILFFPDGKPEIITSAGGYIFGAPGEHGRGNAIDLDGFHWKNKNFITLDYNTNLPFYLATQAILYKHFGVVLGFLFNAAHRDHFHCDLSYLPGFYKSKTYIKFIQCVLSNIYNINTVIDGQYGDKTEAALSVALDRLNMKNNGLYPLIDLQGKWLKFLTETAKIGFNKINPAPAKVIDANPLQKLHNLYSVIKTELSETALRKPIEAALNQFSNDEDIQKFLEQYKPREEKNEHGS